jgi:microcystin-dependent protein
MTMPFIGQIQPMGFNFAPKGWALCDGQVMSIAQNTALFSLLGTMYGGNGTTTFALPDLRGRVPVDVGASPFGLYVQGEAAGSETVTLDLSTLPSHNHAFLGTANIANDSQPSDGAALGTIGVLKQPGTKGDPYYASDAAPQALNPKSIDSVGGNQPHDNMQPFLVINWVIALTGIFPSRN